MKEAYYFSHDSNARNDDKIIKLRMKHKWEGFGLYWAIIERLREATEYICIKDYNIIAFDLRVDASVIKSIIEDFGLFEFTEDGKGFYSKRLKNSMDLKSQKASISAKKRWDKCESNATALQPHSESNAIKVKESKEKESKENLYKFKNPEFSIFKISILENQTLIEKYGIEKTKLCYEKLLDYSKNFPKKFQKYKSHYSAINQWVIGAVEEDLFRKKRLEAGANYTKTITQNSNAPKKSIDL